MRERGEKGLVSPFSKHKFGFHFHGKQTGKQKKENENASLRRENNRPLGSPGFRRSTLTRLVGISPALGSQAQQLGSLRLEMTRHRSGRGPGQRFSLPVFQRRPRVYPHQPSSQAHHTRVFRTPPRKQRRQTLVSKGDVFSRREQGPKAERGHGRLCRVFAPVSVRNPLPFVRLRVLDHGARVIPLGIACNRSLLPRCQRNPSGINAKFAMVSGV